MPTVMSSLDAAEVDVNILLRGLVHELRNPLSAILTASGLLIHSGDPDDETSVLLDIVQKESRRMNRILLEFTAFVKPPPANPETFDLSLLIEAIVADLESERTIRSGVTIHSSLPEELSAFADKEGCRRAISCVLANAMEALPTSGGKIEIQGGNSGNDVQLVIEDNGGGLLEGSQEKAFQPFFSTKPQATGLGLSIARVAARASGGEIELENIPEGGTRVTLTLPRPAGTAVGANA